MNACINDVASSVNPESWSSFEDATASVEMGNYDHIGFVFNDNGIIGIDIDAGFDEDGFLSTLAADIIGKCKSYTEKSKSGRGFHIFLKGSLPFKGKNNLKGVEIYKSARFFITTGDVLLYDTIVENQEAIDYILEKYFPETRAENPDKSIGSRIYTPIWELPQGTRIKLRPVYPRIPDGCRNICLTSLAGMLHNQGYTKQQMMIIVLLTIIENPIVPNMIALAQMEHSPAAIMLLGFYYSFRKIARFVTAVIVLWFVWEIAHEIYKFIKSIYKEKSR